MCYRHRDGRNTLMPLFTSVSPVRAASLPEPLTAVMGLAPDTTSAPEGRRNPAELSATEIARLVTSGDVSTIIDEACSPEGVLNSFMQDEIPAVKDEFAAALSGLEEELDKTITLNPRHEELRVVAGARYGHLAIHDHGYAY